MLSSLICHLFSKGSLILHSKFNFYSLTIKNAILTCSQSAPNFPTANLPSWRVTTAVPTLKMNQNKYKLSHLHYPLVLKFYELNSRMKENE